MCVFSCVVDGSFLSFPSLSFPCLAGALVCGLASLSSQPFLIYAMYGSNPYIWPCDADGHGPVLIYAPMWGGWAWDDWMSRTDE